MYPLEIGNESASEKTSLLFRGRGKAFIFFKSKKNTQKAFKICNY